MLIVNPDISGNSRTKPEPETEPESPKPNRLLKKPETGETGNNRNWRNQITAVFNRPFDRA